MTERRDRIPGVSVETERSLSAMLRRIESRLLALEGRIVRRAPVVGNASALPGETLIVDAPPSGLRISLPQPTQALTGSVVRLVMRTPHDVTIASSLGRVNGGASVVIGRVGTVTATCDGVTGWMLSIDEAALAADLASDSVVFDSASGQLERAALTGEVTASKDSNATSIVRSTDFAWTGNHSFENDLRLLDGAMVHADAADPTSLPSLSADRGVYAVGDPSPAVRPSSPFFKNDANEAYELWGYGTTPRAAGTRGAVMGPFFVIYRDITSSGSSAAGDSTVFLTDAPFDFVVLGSAMILTAGAGTAPAATENVWRTAAGGGGSAASSQFSTLTSAVGDVQIGTSYTGAHAIAANGTLVFRWANRTCEGRVMLICMRTA